MEKEPLLHMIKRYIIPDIIIKMQVPLIKIRPIFFFISVLNISVYRKILHFLWSHN